VSLQSYCKARNRTTEVRNRRQSGGRANLHDGKLGRSTSRRPSEAVCPKKSSRPKSRVFAAILFSLAMVSTCLAMAMFFSGEAKWAMFGLAALAAPYVRYDYKQAMILMEKRRFRWFVAVGALLAVASIARILSNLLR